MSKIQKICETCKQPWLIRPYRKDIARFCSRKCKGEWMKTLEYKPFDHSYMNGNQYRRGIKPKNSFNKGHEPWNKGKKGIHLSPASEFKHGPRPDMRAAIGAESIRRTHDGNFRVFVKIAEPNVWRLRAHIEWEKHHGKIPKGKLIHHDDRDSLNDEILNLICLTRAQHIEVHRKDLNRWPASL